MTPVQKLEQLLDIIDETSALIVMKEDSSIVFDNLHHATALIEEMLSEAQKR
jgi:hypothetical protein